ncbi:hypothetical protein WA171_005565, partial [Blastocystis sp. BT1]
KSLLFVIACCFCLAVSKYSYTDKCYRFGVAIDKSHDFYYQIYVNKKGIPHSRDEIIVERPYGRNCSMYSYYYHYVLSNCSKVETGYRCKNTCESVWFKIDNKTEAKLYADKCDPIFQKKYADVTKHHCNMTTDPFYYVKEQIGRTSTETIEMEGKVPIVPNRFTKDKKCVWEWDVIGLWSLVSVIVFSVIIVIALIVFLIGIILVQKHRSTK